jgi:hypothetical protein
LNASEELLEYERKVGDFPRDNLNSKDFDLVLESYKNCISNCSYLEEEENKLLDSIYDYSCNLRLIKDIQKLNNQGKAKIRDYIDDIIDTGKYKNSKGEK